MAKKDRRPESNPERAKAGEQISRKATHQEGFEDEKGQGQTGGGQEKGPEPGQFTEEGSPGYRPK